MTSTISPSTAPRLWWADQPAPVQAVLDLAYMRPEFGDEAHDRILDAFAHDHANAIVDIATDLTWIERLRCETPCQVLSDYHGQPIHGLYLDVAAERQADELVVGVLTQAQLVASLMAVSS